MKLATQSVHTIRDTVGPVPRPRRGGETPDPDEREPVRFNTLGNLEMWQGRRECTPSTPKLLQVLALLLLRPNRTVQTEVFMRELWGDEPPRSAATTVQTYIYQLRKLFRGAAVGRDADVVLQTRTPGYALRVLPGQLDIEEFDVLRERGRSQLTAGRMGEASRDLRGALELWTDLPLANVRHGSELSSQVVRLQEERRNVQQWAIEAEMALGCHRELVPELQALSSRHGLDEWFCRALMRCLDASGRRGDALEAYRDLRKVLDDELGIPPAPETQELYITLLG